VCHAGASWVQDNILQSHPRTDVAVFVVWFPVLAGDDRSAWDPSVLPDPRVTDFWDGDGIVSSWYQNNVVHTSGIVWDAYFLYGPRARWRATPGRALSAEGPVDYHTGELEAAMRPFLASSR